MAHLSGERWLVGVAIGMLIAGCVSPPGTPNAVPAADTVTLTALARTFGRTGRIVANLQRQRPPMAPLVTTVRPGTLRTLGDISADLDAQVASAFPDSNSAFATPLPDGATADPNGAVSASPSPMAGQTQAPAPPKPSASAAAPFVLPTPSPSLDPYTSADFLAWPPDTAAGWLPALEDLATRPDGSLAGVFDDNADGQPDHPVTQSAPIVTARPGGGNAALTTVTETVKGQPFAFTVTRAVDAQGRFASGQVGWVDPDGGDLKVSLQGTRATMDLGGGAAVSVTQQTIDAKGQMSVKATLTMPNPVPVSPVARPPSSAATFVRTSALGQSLQTWMTTVIQATAQRKPGMTPVALRLATVTAPVEWVVGTTAVRMVLHLADRDATVSVPDVGSPSVAYRLRAGF
jgi:hypothetical protein